MHREQAKQELAGWLLKELDEQSRRERIAFWFFLWFQRGRSTAGGVAASVAHGGDAWRGAG